ncbi:ATPase/GTPase, AAA15 family [Lachnospiraceae bacterium]|nr:ATPase/GTPase, AAA15 family [Lachnospiraceae bacterium]
MKLLRLVASNFKNCRDNFEIDFVAVSKKTAEDREYELQEIAEGLFTYSTLAFVGKNASGKTTAVELLDACYSILGNFRLENRNYDFDNVSLLIDFYYEGYIYRYETVLKNSDSIGTRAIFTEQRIRRKKYYKSKIKSIYVDSEFKDVKVKGELPDDTSSLFFVLKKKETHAVYFDSYGNGKDTYRLIFAAMKDYSIPADILIRIITIFDENVSDLQMLDEHNFSLNYSGSKYIVSDKELLYKLSSGTTKGMLLYILMVASLQNGFDLIIDEVENHFHKTLVENMITLYKDKKTNKKNSTLIFTTHYCEILDLFNRQDNIYIARAEDKVYLTNMYRGFNVRPELLKSRQFYNNVFQTSVNYEDLMNLKKELKK